MDGEGRNVIFPDHQSAKTDEVEQIVSFIVTHQYRMVLTLVSSYVLLKRATVVVYELGISDKAILEGLEKSYKEIIWQISACNDSKVEEVKNTDQRAGVLIDAASCDCHHMAILFQAISRITITGVVTIGVGSLGVGTTSIKYVQYTERQGYDASLLNNANRKELNISRFWVKLSSTIEAFVPNLFSLALSTCKEGDIVLMINQPNLQARSRSRIGDDGLDQTCRSKLKYSRWLRLHRVPILRFSIQTGHRESEIQYSSKGPLIPDVEVCPLESCKTKLLCIVFCNKEDLVSDLAPVSSSG
ncbi:hypothetical protein VNO77_01928 [Canavalia gladiata]|uniref:Uncharacterized protein n=1 Tax=Canavalia gladiata TaxID=3824 RepID=A0AAN9R6R7_CANGL